MSCKSFLYYFAILWALLFSQYTYGLSLTPSVDVDYYPVAMGNAINMEPYSSSEPWMTVTFSNFHEEPTYCVYMNQEYELDYVRKENGTEIYEMQMNNPNFHHYLYFELKPNGKVKRDKVIHRYFFQNTLTLCVICTQQQQDNYSTPNTSRNNGGYSNNGGTDNKSSRRTCPYCNGSGKGADQITYSPNYTGKDNSRYCSTCGKTTFAHSHHRPTCRTCYGKGYVE